MMVIVVYACLQANCGNYVISEAMHLPECLVTSQREAAAWQMMHPRHEVKSVICTFPSLIGLPI